MEFSINKIAREYIYKRYPNASVPEKEKYINDWNNKERDSAYLVKDFIKRVGPVSGHKILDVGCGNGGVSIAFARAGAEVYGVEVEQELYEISKIHSESVGLKPSFYLYDGEKLPFNDSFFDYAVSVSVLEHTDDPKHYLKEILRVVKPDGLIYLGFPNKLWPKETHTGLWFLTYTPKFFRPYFIRFFNKNPLEDNNLHFYGYFDLKNILNQISLEGYGWSIVEESGESKNPLKNFIKQILKIFGLHYKVFLPHILLILKKDKKNEK